MLLHPMPFKKKPCCCYCVVHQKAGTEIQSFALELLLCQTWGCLHYFNMPPHPWIPKGNVEEWVAACTCLVEGCVKSALWSGPFHCVTVSALEAPIHTGLGSASLLAKSSMGSKNTFQQV